MTAIEILLTVWLTALSLAFWFHARGDCLERRTLIDRLERHDRRLKDLMDRVDAALLKLVPS